MSVSAFRQRLLGNPVARTVLSAWAWLVFGIIIIIWVPLVFVVWIVTTPFDRGRYWPGFVFRRLCVAHQLLNPTAADVVYLEVGDRSTGDLASYPDDDLVALQVDGRWRFAHKDGAPY